VYPHLSNIGCQLGQLTVYGDLQTVWRPVAELRPHGAGRPMLAISPVVGEWVRRNLEKWSPPSTQARPVRHIAPSVTSLQLSCSIFVLLASPFVVLPPTAISAAARLLCTRHAS
jgi:hypothetical protein